MYKITTDYLEHRGGTKFYETVMIEEIGGPAMLIKRYGPIVNKIGGGQVIIERGTALAARESRQKIINEKIKSAKGYESVSRPMSGMHTENGNTVGPALLEKIVDDQYATKNATEIKAHFGVNSGTMPALDDDVITEEPEEAKPTIEAPRDSTWGSW